METRRGTTKDRMKEVLQVLGVTAIAFEDKCCLAHGFTRRVSREITKKTRSKIKAVYPNLNIDYIAFGTGEVFLKEGEAEGSIRDRLIQFYNHMDISKQEFVKRTGISMAFILNMSDNIRRSSLERIYMAFPLLNPSWLEYGEGMMLLEKAPVKSSETPSERIARLREFLGITTLAFNSETGITTDCKNITKRTVDRIVRRYPFVNPLWLMHGTGEMIAQQPKFVSQQFSYAPLVSSRAFAGYLSGFADEEYMGSLDKIPYVETPDMRGNVIAVEVSGDSMDDGTADAYRQGDIVIVKEISISEPLPINRYDFVILHKTGILIKQIVEDDRVNGLLRIHSLNKDYGDVVLNASDILKVFIVLMRISRQVHR